MLPPRDDHRRACWVIVAVAAAAVVMCASAMRAGAAGSSVSTTKHNLTSSGPGPIKTTVAGEACIFCHTPHASNPIAPLWNRDDPGSYYETYDSSTLVATVGQPTGSSRLCLSCHDGSIALNQTYNGKNTGGGSVYISSSDRGFIGTDLRDDHPISFRYDAGLAATKGELRDPAAVPASLPLDHNQQMQCSTCHDAHDDSQGMFLRVSNNESGLCRSCHVLTDWSASSHATSTASLAGATRDQWDNISAATVRGAACESCHRPHAAGGRQRLLRHEAEEDNCLNCHDGSVAPGNLAAEFNKISVHPVALHTSVHDPTEQPATMSEHVECADCHDPHRAGSGPTGGAAPQIQPAMFGATGLTSTGSLKAQANYEYEVCYKCHSTNNFSDPVVARIDGDNNLANEFAPTNPSFHPVQTQGKNSDVPSLLQGYTTASIIYCGDCHGSDSATSPAGPHGSTFRPLLKAQYVTRDNTSESAQAYALCYRCHSRTSILSDRSFDRHHTHITDERTPCSACHDPHGTQRNTHLINFDPQIVKPASNGQGPTFTDLGNRRGSCTLRCHGENHNNWTYGL